MAVAKETAELYGGPASHVERGYWDLFAETAAKHPNNEAVVSLWQRSWIYSDGVLRWTYKDLLRLSALVSRWLQGRGCRPGARLAAFLDNSAEWVLFLWVAARMGLVFVPLDRSTIKTDGAALIRAAAPAIVVVDDEDAAKAFDAIAGTAGTAAEIRIICSTTKLSSWFSLLSITGMFHQNTGTHSDLLGQTGDGPMKLIFFTSGTTGQPKGCPLTSANIWSQTWDWEPPPEGTFDRWLVHTPLFHILGCNHALRMFRYGGTVVFSGKRFDVNATFPALEGERCTKMAAVPTMVRALLSSRSFGDKENLALHYITMGGTMITPEDIRLCREGLGVKSAVQGYGLTEGMPITSWHSSDSLLNSKGGYHPGVGKALPGANLRICEPGSTRILMRNEVGELHVSGTSVIDGYLHGIETDAFYEDGSHRWFKTGDQARIDDDGVLHILGRYKDLIIRGGHNISPAKLEAALSEIPGVSAQVIGCPDDVAGQVPVAVLKANSDFDKAVVFERARALGQMFALDAVYFLSELFLESFPVTSVGKVRKAYLREAVLAHRKSKAANQDSSGRVPSTPSAADRHEDRTVSVLVRAWEEIAGVPQDPDTSVLKFADSISILRFCARVHSILNVPFYLQDVQRHKTAREQAELLDKRRARRLNYKDMDIDSRLSPETVVFANGDTGRLTDIQLSTASALEQVGLPISDIEAYVPIPDSLILSASGTRPQSFHHRFVVAVVDSKPAQVQEAIQACISTRQTFRSLLGRLEDSTPFHIVIKPSPQLFKLVIRQVEVDTVQAYEDMVNDDSLNSFPELLMFRARIITCREDPADLRVIFDYNHSAFDMLTAHAFYQDISAFLNDPNAPLPELTPFKRYADTTYLYRDSALAVADVNYHVAQLRQVLDSEQALWPPQLAQGWMIGRDRDSALFPGREAVRARTWGGGVGTTGGGGGGGGSAGPPTPPPSAVAERPTTRRTVDCGALAEIRTAHGVPPKVVLQAALKLAGALATRRPLAVLSVLDDARSWPFMPAWLAELLPPPASIAGPTLEVLMSVTRVDLWSPPGEDGDGGGGGGGGGETVVGYLERVQREWDVCRQHAHAPWSQIRRRLADEHGKLDPRRQMFTWDGSPGVLDSERIKTITRRDWPDW